MTSNGHGDRALVANVHKRTLRATLAVCAFSTYLVGYRTSPVWIFALSTLSIYLMTSALVGRGLLGAMAALSGRHEGEEEALSMDLNIGGWDRTVRGGVALVMMGSVMWGVTIMLDTMDYFIVMLIAFYAGTTAIIAWDPVYAVFGVGTRRARAPAGLLRGRASRVVSLGSYRSTQARHSAAKSRAA